MISWWKPVAWIIGGVILLGAVWGVYKMIVADHAVADAKLAKDYHDQKDSTEAWRASYKKSEDSRAHLRDTLDILNGVLQSVHLEANKWHDSATAAKGRLILIRRPEVSDSTNPNWMHRTIQLETTVAAQDKEIASKDTEIALSNTKQKLLLSQLSKDSVDLYSANGNIERLDKLVEGFKAKADCKVLWLVPCPSRTMSLVGGTILGVLGTVAVERRK